MTQLSHHNVHTSKKLASQTTNLCHAKSLPNADQPPHNGGNVNHSPKLQILARKTKAMDQLELWPAPSRANHGARLPRKAGSHCRD